MYFTVNSAFHISCQNLAYLTPLAWMASYSPKNYIFDIFLNDTSKPSMHPNTSMPILPLDPPDHSFGAVSVHLLQAPHSPQFTFFFPIVWHTSIKIPNYPRKGSFLFSTAAHIAYFCTAYILTCLLAP